VLKLSDHQEYLSQFTSTAPQQAKRITISPTYFSRPTGASLIIPYFAHPDYYRTGIYKQVQKLRLKERRFRIVFAGTFHRDVYVNSFAFPILSRFQILEFLIWEFASELLFVSAGCLPERYGGIVLSVTSDTNDNTRKHGLNHMEYIKFLSTADFMIAPPGWLMPMCHNLVEAMSVGTIPITNYPAYVHPHRLVHRQTSMCFSSCEELRATVRDALSMKEDEVLRIRENVIEYYERFLSP
jgi:hypothetical protein